MTQPNRFVALARHADGEPLSEAHFSIREGSLPTLADGQIVVRPLAMSVDPYMRGRMTGVDTFYLSQFKLGEPIRSLGVGRVLESRQAGYQPGDIVQGLMDWSDCSIWAGAAQLEGGGVLQKVDPSIGKLSHVLGVLGLNGLTAIFGVLGVARPEPGQTILISGAAGGIGSVAGQIARLRGA